MSARREGLLERSTGPVSAWVASTLLVVGAWVADAAAQTGNVAGMITELKLGGGAVEVKTLGASEWRPAAPLTSLLAGDTVRASDGASAVIVLSGGRGMLRVESGAEPVVVPRPQPGESTTRKAGALLVGSLAFLSAHAREVRQVLIGTRGVPEPPGVVLGPRNGPVLDDTLTFEWVGARSARYAVQVLGPNGEIVEQADVEGARWDYPAGAQPLVPGVRYSVRVTPHVDHPPQEAWFELAGPQRTREVRAALALLEQELASTTSPNTVAALQAGYLANTGLLDEARRLLVAALARDPDEPILHLILGNVYAQTGLTRQASQSYDEARFLMRSRPTR